MDAISMTSGGYSSQIASAAKQKQGNVLVKLLEAVRMAEIAQARPLGNLRDVKQVDTYA
jgi:hypothetical protein